MKLEGNPNNKEEVHQNLELGIVAVDAYEHLLDQTVPFIQHTAGFPKEIREKLTSLLLLSGSEIHQIASRAQETFDNIEARSGGKIVEKSQAEYLEREIGSEMFFKLYHYLLDATMMGELPDNLENTTGMSEFKIKHSADTLIENIRPILVRNFITSEGESEG
jgi:hypothetical protein